MIPIIERYRNIVKLSDQENKMNSISRQQLAAIAYYCEVFETFLSFSEKLSQFRRTFTSRKIVKRFAWLVKLILEVGTEITRQQVLDMTYQLWQYDKMVHFCRLMGPSDFDRRHPKTEDELEKVLFKFSKLTADDKRFINDSFRPFYSNESEDELYQQKSIVESSFILTDYYAETSCAGRWFKCSNGHYFSRLANNNQNEIKCPKCSFL